MSTGNIGADEFVRLEKMKKKEARQLAHQRQEDKERAVHEQ